MIICGANKSLPSAPRSKGCLTCLSRKTRCDGRRPTCQRCEERKQICRGYRRQDYVFLNDGWRAPGVSSSVTEKKSPGKTSRKRETSIPEDEVERFTTSPVLILSRTPSPERRQLHTVFFLSEFGADILNGPHFILDLFYRYLSTEPSLQYLAASCRLSSEPAVFAAHALAGARFGRIHSDSVSTQESIRTYGAALRAMSAKLEELKYADSGFQVPTEDNWQHLAFFCIVMACWELEMFPTSRKWHEHIRGLAAAILLRGSEHAYSVNNERLVASSRLFVILQVLSSRQPSFLSSLVSEGCSRPPSSAALKVEVTRYGPEVPNTVLEHGIYDPLDILTTEAASTVAIIAQYDQLRASTSKVHSYDDGKFGRILISLRDKADAILNRVETQLMYLDMATYETPLIIWLSRHRNVGANSTRDFWLTVSLDLQSVVDTVLSFPTMREHHIVTLFWTTAMSLRLLLSDMLTTMLTIPPLHDIYDQVLGEIEQHRIKLMGYAQKVIHTIGYGALKENRAVAPFFLATAFQMAIVTLERECETLRACGRDKDTISRCERMKDLAVLYVEWAAQNKIPIKMDMNVPR
ncbi:uncharacterized protein F4822DRAFT_424842 [Hypoxylon trugodes]|uniref:uncharacterized protein n=1 Tax=Hypoxylon trugodes TaxID=326681 RepID=UPI00218E7375|nr:uncharacterized protein F4822DRAFT_424842 [Hypoxylon trugodes]KAI1394363.1 hypothetical protein F4822DRAFT_424842 [Hypoxylon trugodes]